MHANVAAGTASYTIMIFSQQVQVRIVNKYRDVQTGRDELSAEIHFRCKEAYGCSDVSTNSTSSHLSCFLYDY